MALEPDTLPLLPPSATELPLRFSYHPESYGPRTDQPTPLHGTVLQPTSHNNHPRGSPPNPFRPPENTLNAQSRPRHSTDTDDTSLLPAYTPARYRGHATEEEYLAALRAWAEEKMYVEPAGKSALVGFYGEETMEERIERAPPPLKLRVGRKRRERERKREGKGEREDEEMVGDRENVEGKAEGKRGRRRSSFANWLSRKRMA